MQLIAELKRLPQNARVGVSHHDNSTVEVAGWVNSAELVKREDMENDSTYTFSSPEEMPPHWVTLHT